MIRQRSFPTSPRLGSPTKGGLPRFNSSSNESGFHASSRYVWLAVVALLFLCLCAWSFRSHGTATAGTPPKVRPPLPTTLPGRRGRFIGTGVANAGLGGGNSLGSVQPGKADALKNETDKKEPVEAPAETAPVNARSSEKVLAASPDEKAVAPGLPLPRGFYSLRATDIDGNEFSFEKLTGKVVLIVNVASACGYTEQNYRGLELLYEKYGPHGLEIIGFPSNQFGGQEPGSNEHIKKFVTSRYNITFPLMAKADVNGFNAHPVFQFLKRELPTDQGGGGGIGIGNDLVWNFNKFLVDKHGRPSVFYYQNFDQAKMESDVYTHLKAP